MSGAILRPSFADDLDGTLAEAFRLFARGVVDRRSAFHTPTLGTVGRGGGPRLRTVVLRAFDAGRRVLRFHTDARSAKAEEIEAGSGVALHVYDPGAKVQIRIEGRAALHAGDPIGDAAWSSSRRMSRACYAVTPAPGSALVEADGFILPTTDEEMDAGRVNFLAVLVTIERLEWLWLAHDGHRRAEFAFGPGDSVSRRWLVP
jgi:pyridoxamine 5'-phosphate oxidase